MTADEREPISVEVIALMKDTVGDDGCRLEVGDRITIQHAMMHPEAVTTEPRP